MTAYLPRALDAGAEARRVSAVSLPVEIRRVIDRVLKRSRLWPGERADVENELAAHFADGLASGLSVEHLIRDFGDPDAAAGLIRRAKIRGRSRAWHAWRNVRTGLLVALVLVPLSYGAIVLRYWMGTPTITHDLREEFNAPIRAIPQAQQAWPLYRQALAAMVSPPRAGEPDESGVRPRPLSPYESVDGAKANQPAIALIRKAASLPHLGVIIDNPEDMVFVGRQQARLSHARNWESQEIAVPSSEGKPAFMILLPQLGLFRQFSQLLGFDIDRGIGASDRAAVSEDLVAMIRLAVQTRETPFMISDLVSLAIGELAMAKMREALTLAPAIVSDEALREFASSLIAMGPRPDLVRFDAELKSFEDILQRSFTDDGHGDGRMTPAGAKLLAGLAEFNGPNRTSLADVATLPLSSTLGPGRKRLHQNYAALVESSKQWALQPPWSRPPAPEPEATKVPTLPLSPYSYLALLAPAFHQSIRAADRFDTTRGATLAVIALEQFKRQTGTLPSSLAELVPSYLPSLPADVADGQPLRYKPTGDSFVLYSIGADKKDDGGKLPPSEQAAVGISNFHWGIDAAKVDYDWVFFPFAKLPKEEAPKPSG